MQFRVLGPVEAVADGQRARLGGGHRRTILAVLLAAGGHTVSTDRLIGALWGDRPPATARKSLQSHLARLRGALATVTSAPDDAAAVVVSSTDGYRLPLDRHDLDARTFEHLVARARTAAGDDPRQALRLLDDAKALVRGPAFAELATHPAIRAEALRLEGLIAAADADHIDACLALARHEEVIGDLAAAVAREPLDERAHGQLMLALYRSGRQADALAAYTTLRERLRAELGLDPSPTLRDLHERILRQEPQLDVRRGPSTRATAQPGTAGPRRPTDSSGTGPPPVASELIGREEDVAAVAELLTASSLVTLTGPGGVGKTRLAEQVAASVADGHDEVVSCELAGVRDPDAVGDALIATLGIQPTGEQTAEQSLTAALGDRRLLLLVDNCEHVLTAVTPVVAAILRRCPHVLVLATSRERLRLTEERVWPVAPLPVPDPDAEAREVGATPAVALFVARAQAAERTFELTTANAAAVAELCRRLDGMPLAIELAAARIRSMAPADLVERLDRRFSLLAGGPRHEDGRHRTLEAVVAWSYDLLEPAEAELFQRLSVFAGSFTLEAAERTCAGDPIADVEVAGLVGDLVDRSMVIVERRMGTVRYRLLDTLREFGGQRLDAAGRTERLRRSHAQYHMALAEQLGPRMRGPHEPEAAAGIDAAIDDLRAAHGWLVRTGDVDGALRLPAALGEYVFFRLRDEITTWARRAVALPGAAARPAYAAALTTAAQGATNRDECARAHEEAATALAHTDPDGAVALSALWAAGTAAFYEGRLDDMVPIADRQAELADRLGEPFYRAFADVLRVLGHSYRGDQAAAQAALPALEEAATTAGSPTMQAFAWYCRGEVHLEVRAEEACRAFERAVELAREVDNALIEGVSLVSLASIRGRLGETERALRLFRDVVAHWQRLGDHTHQLTTLRNVVEMLARIRADEAAAELYGAVTAGLAPTFGAEAQRLRRAWEAVAERLGPEAADDAVAVGRAHTTAGMADAALRHLDNLLEP